MRMYYFVQELSHTNPTVLVFGATALVLLFMGDKWLPGKPSSLAVVIIALILVKLLGLSHAGLDLAGEIPKGLPMLSRPSLRLSDVDGITELAFACFLMGYIETISAARALGLKNGYSVDARQELLSLGFANFSSAFSGGYVVAGGLSQSIVNDRAGARTPMSLLVCSGALAIILIFFTGLLRDLPMVVLAAIVIHAVMGLIRVRELDRIRRISPLEFYVAMTALVGVLMLGILKGVMVAVLLSLLLLLRKASIPHVAELGQIDDSDHFSDMERHPDNKIIPGLMILRPEAPMLYFNIQNIMDAIRNKLSGRNDIKSLILDMSVVNYIDDTGSLALVSLARELQQLQIEFKLTDALSEVRDMLRQQGMEEVTGHISRQYATNDAVMDFRTSHLGHY
jgi:anti-anti-sigma factor